MGPVLNRRSTANNRARLGPTRRYTPTQWIKTKPTTKAVELDLRLETKSPNGHPLAGIGKIMYRAHHKERKANACLHTKRFALQTVPHCAIENIVVPSAWHVQVRRHEVVLVYDATSFHF